MAVVHERSNKATASEAASFCAEVNRLEEERERKAAEIDAKFKKAKRDLNKKINAEQQAILDDAKKVGVGKGLIRAITKGMKGKRLAQEKLDAKIDQADELIEALEDDDRAYAVSIREALGEFSETPLGAAAVAKEGEQDERTAAIVEAVEKTADPFAEAAE